MRSGHNSPGLILVLVQCACTHTHAHTHARTHTHTHTHTISHLSVLCAYHKTFGLQPSAFISALGYVIANQACLRTSPLPGDTAQPIGAAPSAPGDWVDKLLGALEGLLTEVYSVLCSHLILMDVMTTAGVESLTGWIQ